MKKIFVFVFIAVITVFCLTACSDPVIGASNDGSTGAGGPEEAITLKGDSAKYAGSGVSIEGSVITVRAPGEYTITGQLDNGRIIVDTGEDPGDVTLVLNNADITCLTGSAIYVAQAKNVDIVLAVGSTNVITSGTETDLSQADGTSNGAAIFAEDDLDIKGEGSLEIRGYINNGITCKDDLDIKGGHISVLAANNGIRGSESVSISDGILAVNAQNDGIKSTSSAKEGKGYVEISGGDIAVTSMGDGISAETVMNISGGNIVISTTGDPTVVSSKGLKAKTDLNISGGTITLTSTDHSIHSAAGLTVSGGSINLNSSDGKGISVHGDINIADGELVINSIDDGIESATAININGGRLNITAGNDGLKAGKKGTGFEVKVGAVSISGGKIYISAYADPIDAKAKLLVSGGSVLACGISKNIKNFSSDSTQAFVACTLNGSGNSTLLISVPGEPGENELASMTVGYGFNTVLFSAPELTVGSEYTITSGSGSVNAFT